MADDLNTYRRVREGEPLWVCGTCGAAIVEDAWPVHDRWHRPVSAPIPAPSEGER